MLVTSNDSSTTWLLEVGFLKMKTMTKTMITMTTTGMITTTSNI